MVTMALPAGHCDIIAAQLAEFCSARDFLNFAATMNFSHRKRFCKKVQAAKQTLLQGVGRIRKYGLLLPPFTVPRTPTVTELDPQLLPDPIRHYERKWRLPPQLRSQQSNPLRILQFENRFHRRAAPAIAFMRHCVQQPQMAVWERVLTHDIPWETNPLARHVAKPDAACADYVILYVQYQTMAVAMCFFEANWDFRAGLSFTLNFDFMPTRSETDSSSAPSNTHSDSETCD